ncbi:MAG: cupin domain-containing protein [Granulosicoccus sp.]|nr:cupin domain-containing protein [Granulosicoccus sp.]
MPPSSINWPDGLDEAGFLARYWQKQPLLIRQALPDFQTPLPAEELAGLSVEPDTTPRLITRDEAGAYHLEHGPFTEERFATLTGNDWSLLVTDVEKHLPELAAYLRPFSFVPTWRMDDLMISYAPVGASVGAHVDEYDVFLLQASGSRQWSINSREAAHDTYMTNSELKLLSSFEAKESWNLHPGDLLYLPPGVPHHGVASAEPCTTWSIGCRAPALPDFVMRVAEMICEQLPQARYTDATLKPASPGEIDAAALSRFATVWRNAVNLDTDELATLTGRFLTESFATATGDQDAVSGVAPRDSKLSFRVAPFSRLAWCSLANGQPGNERVRLFVDGHTHDCSRALAMHLCSVGQPLGDLGKFDSAGDRSLVQTLLSDGALIVEDSETPG